MRTLFIILIICVAFYAAFVLALYLMGKHSQARAVSGFVPDCLVLFKNLLRDRRVSGRYKVLLVFLIGYLALPIDLVPDFIPIAGQLDDAILVVLVLRLILRRAGPELAAEHWPGPAGSLALLLKLARLR